MTELEGRLKKLGVSVNKFAEMVGIRASAMRLIVLGVNNPKPSTKAKIDDVLSHLRSCPTCGRAFIDGDADDSNPEVKAPKAKEKRR